MDRGPLRSAIPGESAEQSHRDRIRRKRSLLHPADGRAFHLYPEERPAAAVWALQVLRPCRPVPLLRAAADPGVGKPLERCRGQLRTGGNGLPDRVYALRGLPGGSDLPLSSPA